MHSAQRAMTCFPFEKPHPESLIPKSFASQLPRTLYL